MGGFFSCCYDDEDNDYIPKITEFDYKTLYNDNVQLSKKIVLLKLKYGEITEKEVVNKILHS